MQIFWIWQINVPHCQGSNGKVSGRAAVVWTVGRGLNPFRCKSCPSSGIHLSLNEFDPWACGQIFFWYNSIHSAKFRFSIFHTKPLSEVQKNQVKGVRLVLNKKERRRFHSRLDFQKKTQILKIWRSESIVGKRYSRLKSKKFGTLWPYETEILFPKINPMTQV